MLITIVIILVRAGNDIPDADICCLIICTGSLKV